MSNYLTMFFEEKNGSRNGTIQIDGILEVFDSWWVDGIVVASDVRAFINYCRDITVYINSPGGNVMAGAEIYTALREHSERNLGKITVKVTGIAASAASVVAMAGDEILMSPVAYMMVHNPLTDPGLANAKDLRKHAEVLDTIAEGIIAAYQRRTGKTRDELVEMLDAETYMSAQMCIDEGFADGMMWEDPPVPAENGAGRGRATMLKARNYGREQIVAMLDMSSEPEPEPEEPDDEEIRRNYALRAETCIRALTLGDTIARQ